VFVSGFWFAVVLSPNKTSDVKKLKMNKKERYSEYRDFPDESGQATLFSILVLQNYVKI
jgi:hypothetical protein